MILDYISIYYIERGYMELKRYKWPESQGTMHNRGYWIW